MSTPEPPAIDCAQEWDDLLFGVRRSVRYHMHRQRFFDQLHTVTTASAVIFGSATFLTLLRFDRKYALYTAAAVTVMSTLDLVIGFSRRSRLCQDLARRFIQLEKNMVTVPPRQRDEAKLAQFTAERLDIEADEPPVNRIVDTIAHNELTHAMGCDVTEEYHLSRTQRLLANIFPYGVHKLKKMSGVGPVAG